MKFIYIILILLSTASFGQNKPYEIEVTSNKNVFLYFPSPIEKGMTGNTNYVFGYDTNKAEKFGILKAQKESSETTLHVITQDQKVYSFIIKYNSETTKFDHFFSTSNALGNMNESKKKIFPKKDINSSSITKGDKITDDNYFEDKNSSSNNDFDFSKELISRGDFYKKYYKTNNNIVLRLSNIAYNADKSFIFLTILNKSSVDYDVNLLQFNKTAKKVSKKSSNQSIEIKPLSTYQEFRRIPAGETKTAVYIFDKISIDKFTKINIELNELRGERNIVLPVSHQYINNPNN